MVEASRVEQAPPIADDRLESNGMPIYEYICRPCGCEFEALIRGESDAPRCPRCGELEVVKQFSVPAAVHPGAALPTLGSAPAPSGGGCGMGGCGGGTCGMGMD